MYHHGAVRIGRHRVVGVDDGQGFRFQQFGQTRPVVPEELGFDGKMSHGGLKEKTATNKNRAQGTVASDETYRPFGKLYVGS